MDIGKMLDGGDSGRAPATVVTAEQAADLARPHLPDGKSVYNVRSGEEYRDQVVYGLRWPVPLEEMWLVSALSPSVGLLEGWVSLTGISKRTGEVLVSTSFYDGG